MAAVFGRQGCGIHCPVAADVAVIAAGDQFHIAVFVEGRPDTQKCSVLAAVQEGAIGDEGFPILFHCRYVRIVAGAPQEPGFGYGMGQIFRQFNFAYSAVADLEPFVTENDVRFSSFVYIQSAVQTFPISRGGRLRGHGNEGAVRAVADQNVGATAFAGSVEGGKQIKLAPVEVDFRRPEFLLPPEIIAALENGFGL